MLAKGPSPARFGALKKKVSAGMDAGPLPPLGPGPGGAGGGALPPPPAPPGPIAPSPGDDLGGGQETGVSPEDAQIITEAAQADPVIAAIGRALGLSV